MKVLILGGTNFVGRILTENLIKSEHDITLFNRGSKKDLFREVKKITGDRYKDDIKKIGESDWDVIVDFSGQQPANIEYILDIIKGRVKRYIFISSASVYFTEDIKVPITEDNETMSCSNDEKYDPDIMKYYGQKKAECDRILLSREDIDVIIFRPALIYGRYDFSDRFYYWLYRASIEKLLIPEEGKEKSTSTYSDDLACIIQDAISVNKHRKLYNAVTHAPASLRSIVDTAAEKLGKHPEIVSAPPVFLTENGINPWTDLPLWVKDLQLIIDNTRLKEDFSKVKLTPFEESINETIDYYRSIGWPVPKYGISIEKESELINELKKKY
jgi:2'-hydroxyisoflavone reductase